MDFLATLRLDELFGPSFSLVIKTFPYWATIFLFLHARHLWLHYVQTKYRANLKWVLLELKLPKEISKTPQAMEVVLNALYQPSKGNRYEREWKGKVKDKFSLEMVSLEGHVKFFIRCTQIYKNVIEAQLYSQYPDIEIFEVPDYTRYVDYTGQNSDWMVAGVDFKLTKADAYPIKTYVDYGLDKEGVKEEYKTDPLTSIIEYLGSPGKGEQVWIQIIISGAGPQGYYPKKSDGTDGDWKTEGEQLIDKITLRKGKKDEKGEGGPRVQNMTDAEKEVVKAVERNMDKFGFECAIRAMYVCRKDKFNPSNIKAIFGLFRPFSSGNLNGFGPSVQTFGFDFPWEDYKGIRATHFRKAQFDAYKRRAFDFVNDLPSIALIRGGKSMVISRLAHPFVLTTEELATIFHLPGGVAQTPTFGRIPSRKSEAPTNLPI